MKWLLLALVVFLLVFAFIDNRRESQDREAQAAWRTQKQEEIQFLARKWSADQDWEKQLAGPHGTRSVAVMSAELQRLWFDGSPILFVGTLEDVAKQPDGSFEVVATHDGFNSSRLFIMSEIELRAACSESVGNKILAAHAKDGTANPSGVAVVARITEVARERTCVQDAEDVNYSLKRVGIGECLDAMYIGPKRIW